MKWRSWTSQWSWYAWSTWYCSPPLLHIPCLVIIFVAKGATNFLIFDEKIPSTQTAVKKCNSTCQKVWEGELNNFSNVQQSDMGTLSDNDGDDDHYTIKSAEQWCSEKGWTLTLSKILIFLTYFSLVGNFLFKNSLHDCISWLSAAAFRTFLSWLLVNHITIIITCSFILCVNTNTEASLHTQIYRTTWVFRQWSSHFFIE